MCGAVLSFLTSTEAQKTLLSIPTAMQALLQLPFSLKEWEKTYPPEEDEEDEDIEQIDYKEPFLRLIYAISSLPEYETLARTDSFIDFLTTQIVQEPPEPAPWILLCNSIFSEEQARQYMARSMLEKHILGVLRRSKDDGVHLPVLRLAFRIAIYPEHQTRLWEAGIPGTARVFIRDDAWSKDIQCDSIALIRLLIRDNTSNINTLCRATAFSSPEGRDPISEIMALFRRTDDPRVKLEVGLLVVEIVRTTAKEQKASEVTTSPSLINLQALEAETPDLIGPVALLAWGKGEKDTANANPVRTKGWLGLALFAELGFGRAVLRTLRALEMDLRKVVYQDVRNADALIIKLRELSTDHDGLEDLQMLDGAYEALTMRQSIELEAGSVQVVADQAEEDAPETRMKLN